MMECKPVAACFWEDSGAAVRATVRDINTGSYITQAAISNVDLAVFDLSADDPTVEIYSEALTVSSVVYDTLQTDGVWTYSIGYNFKHIISSTAFPTGSHVYVLEYVFTPASGQPFRIQMKGVAHNIVGS